jgi:hypothetical protein
VILFRMVILFFIMGEEYSGWGWSSRSRGTLF